MKTYRMFAVLALLLSASITSYGQQLESEVPGDHFSLEGALELFKQSDSPEEFERLLNSPDSKVNNLDLNGDGYIDYIRVHDRYERNVHAFIIQAVISERENQDIAVIELEKLSNGKAVLQIIGNEDIYGIETIIEPTSEVRTYAGTRSTRTIVNVWSWPSVQYVYGPYYNGWSSPWGWHRRPVWWRSWRPVAYVHYYPIWRPYRPYYAYCDTRRVVYAHHIYHPYRTSSMIVRDRYHHRVTRYRSEYSDGRHRDRYRNDRDTYAERSRTDRQRQSQQTYYNNLRDRNTDRTETSERRRTELSSDRDRFNGAPVARPTRPTTSDRKAASEYQRNTRRIERTYTAPESRQRVITPNERTTRDTSPNRPTMERRAPYSSQRSISPERRSSADIQRSTPPSYRRSESPARSQTITPNPGIRQQTPSRPSTLNRSRQLPSHATPQRPATRTRE